MQGIEIRGLYAIINLPYPFELSLPQIADALIAGGVRVLQLRAKEFSTSDRIDALQQIIKPCRAKGVALVVNDDVEAALQCDVWGVHLGQEDWTTHAADIERLRQKGLGLGISTHNLEQFRAAHTFGVDYIALGPIFATRSKRNPEPVVGLETLQRCASESGLPVVAIGGLDAIRARQCYVAGAAAVAVISAVEAHDPNEISERCAAFCPTSSRA